MGFFDRLSNLFKGFLSLFIGGLEKDNPEAVYEAAIQSRQDQYQKLMKAVSGIVYLRNKLQKDLEGRSADLKEVMTQIPVAVQQGEEQLALQLIEKKNTLSAEVEQIKRELNKTAEDAERHKQDLLQFQGEIEKLKGERDRMLARHQSARARIAIQAQLTGLSVEADVKALDQVRESIMKTEAQADLTREMGGETIDSKMRKIKDAARQSAAAAELEQYKIQLGLAQPASDGDKSLGTQQARTEKTM